MVSLESVPLPVQLSGPSSLGADAGMTGFSLSLPRSGSHQLRPAWAGCLGGCEVRRPYRHPNRPHRQLVWPDDADRPRVLNSRPELPDPQRRSSNANSLGGQNSARFLEICATFQRDILRRHLGVRVLHAQPSSRLSTNQQDVAQNRAAPRPSAPWLRN